MGNVKKIGLILMLIFTMTSLSGSIFSQVTHHPNANASLEARWEWAKQEAEKQKLKNGFWIGYNIKRLMREDRYIYSTDKHTITGSHFTDFPKGDFDTLIRSIKEQLWTMGDDVEFIPGHGPLSTIGHERQTNPFIH